MVLNIINHLHSIRHKKVNYVWVVQADPRELACTVKKSTLSMCFFDVHHWMYMKLCAHISMDIIQRCIVGKHMPLRAKNYIVSFFNECSWII
jgi:hypothetical protein